MILYFKTPDRQKDAVYTDLPHIYEKSHLFTVKGAETPFSGALNDVRSYRFGSVLGYSHGKDYDGADYLGKNLVKDERTLLKVLLGGRIDIAVGNKPAILMHAKKDDLHDKIVFLSPAIDDGPNFFALSKAREDAEDLAQAFSKIVGEFIESSTYRSILEKYGFDLPDS